VTSIKVSNNTKRNFPEGTATDDRREAKDNMEIKLLVQVTKTFPNVVLSLSVYLYILVSDDRIIKFIEQVREKLMNGK
jgi:hypothetical protein